MSEITTQRVAAFIRDELWTPKGGLSEHTTLRDDLGIAGAEAAEFMQDFSEEFDVDLSNFYFDRYFERETNALLLPVGMAKALFRAFSKGEKQEGQLVPIAIKDLVRSAEAKKWVPPEDSL